MSEENEHSDVLEILEPPHVRAELVFSFAAFAFAAFLGANTQSQLVYVNGAALTSQPGFWSLLGVYGMLLFGAGNLAVCVRRNLGSDTGAPVIPELLLWLKALEYVGWFLAYVIIVPRLGYLPSTLLFCLLLCLRLGYHSKMAIFTTIAAVGVIVVFFRALLQVKIPAGRAYELLPDAIRAFFLTYL